MFSMKRATVLLFVSFLSFSFFSHADSNQDVGVVKIGEEARKVVNCAGDFGNKDVRAASKSRRGDKSTRK